MDQKKNLNKICGALNYRVVYWEKSQPATAKKKTAQGLC